MTAVAVVLFHQLGTMPVRLWDESRLAANSIEMVDQGFSLAPTYEGEPDMWNTKPPLLIWIQAATMKLFGISELSLRIPSALAGMGMAMLIFMFVRKHTQNDLAAAAAALIPFTTAGFMHHHHVRSGDYDALLNLLVLGFGIAFYLYTQYQRPRHLYLTFLLITLAVLTKSTAALLPLPALGLWALISRQFIPLLRSKHFWFGALGTLVAVAAYYLGREAFNPGYLAAVDFNEIRGRFLDVNDGHAGDFWHYLRLFSDEERFGFWIWVLIPAVPLSLINQDKKNRAAAGFAILFWVTYLAIVSYSETKLRWYDLPAYPWFAITIGMAIANTWRMIQNQIPSTLWRKVAGSVAVIVLLTALYIPYSEMVKHVSRKQDHPWEEDLYNAQYMMKEAITGTRSLEGYKLLEDKLKQRISFYRTHLCMHRARCLDEIPLWQVQPGDSLIVYDPYLLQLLEERFYLTETEASPWWNIRFMLVEGFVKPTREGSKRDTPSTDSLSIQ